MKQPKTSKNVGFFTIEDGMMNRKIQRTKILKPQNQVTKTYLENSEKDFAKRITRLLYLFKNSTNPPLETLESSQ